jgi:hypothetical protein
MELSESIRKGTLKSLSSESNEHLDTFGDEQKDIPKSKLNFNITKIEPKKEAKKVKIVDTKILAPLRLQNDPKKNSEKTGYRKYVPIDIENEVDAKSR